MFKRFVLLFICFVNFNAFAAEDINQKIIDAFKSGNNYHELKTLLAAKTLNPNTIVDSDSGLCIVHLMAALGQYEQIWSLYQNGFLSTPEIKDIYGHSPLDVARIVLQANQAKETDFEILEESGLGSLSWLVRAHENNQTDKKKKESKRKLKIALETTIHHLHEIVFHLNDLDMEASSYEFSEVNMLVVTTRRTADTAQVNNNLAQVQQVNSTEGFVALSRSEEEENFTAWGFANFMQMPNLPALDLDDFNSLERDLLRTDTDTL